MREAAMRRSWASSGLILVFFALFVSACGDLLGTGGSGIPGVVSANPAAGTANVSVHSTLRIRFSTDLDQNSVVDAVTLREGDRILRFTTYLQDRKIVLLEPTDPLDFGTTYRIVVDPTLRSRSGKSLSEQESWDFTTEGDPLPPPNADSMRANLEVLAHDSMMGRGSGTPDEYRAAQFVMERFLAYGLESAPGGSIQPFQLYSDRVERTITSQNVLATVPGTGSLADEWLVVGAHYDHIGLREQEDGTMGLNNGADDNASGTVMILEMARVFREYVASGAMPVEDRRSVLFAAFGAEEVGLLGSCYYASHAPAVPITMTRAMMNFDMVGRLRDRVLLVRGFETSGDWASMAINANHPKLILYDPPPCENCSDFACFRNEGVPYIWFFTGTHEEYHTPADDVERINFSGLAEIGEVSLRVLTRLAVMPEGPGL